MKLSIGFASVTTLLIIVAAFGIIGISNAGSGFKNYRELAKDSLLCGRLQANMLLTRIQVKNFVISDDLSAVEKYEERLAKTKEFASLARKDIQNPERAKMVSEINSLISNYDDAFKEAIDQQTRRNQIMSNSLNQNGPRMEQILSALLGSSRDLDDSDTSFHAGSALRDLLMARVHVAKYAKTNSISDQNEVANQFASMRKSLAAATNKLTDKESLSKLAELKELRQQYIAAFEAFVSATESRNQLVSGTLDKIGPEISELAENVKLSVKRDQDALGPVVQDGNRNASSMITAVSFAAAVAAIAITLLLSRMLTRPIIALVKAMQQADANNDLTVELSKFGNDEVGMMASSFNNFVKNLRHTISTVSDSTLAVSAASVQLTQTAQDLTDGAGTTSSNSAKVTAVSQEMSSEIGTIAQSTERMSSNVRIVADAMGQMTESISEIASNTAEASAVACDASDLAEESQAQIGMLSASADEIGKVIEVIQDIAEQTNLLALNATIEAARAGDAGQGFAVVASEVKQLAKQTADATETIRSQVGEMQTATGNAVGSIEKISGAIRQVNQVSTSIASAVEEQSVTSQEISRTMNQTSVASDEVSAGVQRSAQSTGSLSESIAEVDRAAQHTATGAKQTRSAGDDLSSLATELSDLVGKFRIA